MSFRLFALSALSGLVCLAGEVRGVWVNRDTLASRERIRAALTQLAEAHFNAAFVNVWSRGYPAWPSQTFQRETGILIDPAFEGRDPLQEAIEEARPLGIAIIPWLEYGFAGGWSGYHPGASGKGPIFDAHPDWLAVRRSGDGAYPVGSGYHFWMVHTRPDVQEFLLAMVEELARDYEVPAIQFDRARYPSLDCGYDEYTKDLYAREHDGAQPPEPNNPEWIEWRARRINDFLDRLHHRVKQTDWRVLVTNAPGLYRYAYVNFAQDYPEWVRRGSLDFVTPQIYRNDAAAFETELRAQMRALPDNGRHVPGIKFNNPEDLARQIEIVRECGLPGVVIWYYNDLASGGALSHLRETVYAVKSPLPWRWPTTSAAASGSKE